MHVNNCWLMTLPDRYYNNVAFLTFILILPRSIEHVIEMIAYIPKNGNISLTIYVFLSFFKTYQRRGYLVKLSRRITSSKAADMKVHFRL